MKNSRPSLRSAYAACRHLARRHYENFPVTSYLVPRGRRNALAAIYAFARHADDVADVPAVEDRLGMLEDWRQKLRDCYAGKAAHPVFVALQDTIGKFRLSETNFVNLLRAFESDVRTNRHLDYDSLLIYCACSANPVGRLVLELFGHRSRELFVLSDHICTGLQLANFWQDVGIDFARGRIYLPLEDLASFDYSMEDLRAGRVDERWRALMAFEVGRAREEFELGRPLTELVVPALRRQLRLTWLGGMEILAMIEACGYDVFRQRPHLTKLDFLRLYLRSRKPPAPVPAAPAPTTVSQ